MLSILIPVFNFDVTNLVEKLHFQATNADITFEIILIDDASSEQFREKNKKLIALKGVIYHQEEINIGRSKIRNKLADNARYPYLLFLDCDSQVAFDNYIKLYLEYISKDIVVCGGRVYEEIKPDNPDLILRWKHGRLREVFSVESRRKYPNRSFMTNNFFISKELFNKIRFDEGINGYGHEDTLFGFELKKHNIQIIHIDNPLIHIGLEHSVNFLEKTKEGIRNLKYISGINNHERILIEDIKLLHYFHILEHTHLKRLFADIFKRLEKSYEKNLKGKNPSLFIFDLYKLGYMCSL